MAPESFSLVNVYRMDELAKAPKAEKWVKGEQI